MPEAQNPGNRRNALLKPGYMLAVNPNGRFVKCRVASNINNGVFHQVDGVYLLRPAAQKEGWKTLDEVCTDAERKKLDEFFKFDEEHNGAIRKMPAEIVPAKVKAMRTNSGGTPAFPGFAKAYKAEDEAKAAELAKAVEAAKPKLEE